MRVTNKVHFHHIADRIAHRLYIFVIYCAIFLLNIDSIRCLIWHICSLVSVPNVRDYKLHCWPWFKIRYLFILHSISGLSWYHKDLDLLVCFWEPWQVYLIFGWTCLRSSLLRGESNDKAMISLWAYKYRKSCFSISYMSF